MTIEQLIENKKQYNSLLEKLDIIQKNINNSISEIATATNHYRNSYTIDEELADKKVLLKTNTELNEISKKIEIIKYKINSKIVNINNSVDDYYNASSNDTNNNSNHPQNNKPNINGNLKEEIY
ncbi:MAG: hypothetical protein ACI310_00030 [Bacilli bacterium]